MTRLGKALTVFILWLAAARLSFSQNPAERQPCPDVTAESLGCELIAWSHLQEAVPLPLTSPDSDHDRQERARASNSDFERLQSLQTVVGVIVKNHGKFWLKISTEVDLLIDDWQTARLYEGRRVKITGVLDAESKILKVEGIAPLS